MWSVILITRIFFQLFAYINKIHCQHLVYHARMSHTNTIAQYKSSLHVAVCQQSSILTPDLPHMITTQWCKQCWMLIKMIWGDNCSIICLSDLLTAFILSWSGFFHGVSCQMTITKLSTHYLLLYHVTVMLLARYCRENLPKFCLTLTIHLRQKMKKFPNDTTNTSFSPIKYLALDSMISGTTMSDIRWQHFINGLYITYFNSLVYDWGNSSALAMELPQSCFNIPKGWCCFSPENILVFKSASFAMCMTLVFASW